ncbi:MAG: FAD-dependent oxidoreductase, partial [Planctomycetaceae bacterium]|nr:FAD-dependent oxidoreductase [Planctomycetaceae bacterium]
DDSNIAPHKRMNDAIHAFNCLTVAEINHGGRNANMHRTGLQPVGPSDVPNAIVGGHSLKVPTIAEIKEIIGKYRDGARRAIAAGYDIISIHGAHGYLITNFLSPKYNQRTDEYGGSDENRVRLALEIYDAVRQEVGKDVPVGIRISMTEDIEGGITVEQSIALIQRLEKLGLDFVDVSAGTYDTLPILIQPMDQPQGCLLPFARQMRQNVKVPVIGAGRINDIDLAERALSDGDADFVHMGRAFHADPEILAKTLRGAKEEVVGCIACNKCCSQLFSDLRSVCTVNPRAGRERTLKLIKTDRPRRVMVVGGGMAGMEAATVAAQRGHDVTLYEKNQECGGYVTILKAPPTRKAWGRATHDRVRMLEQSGAKIVTGRVVTAADVEAERPDVLILATGTRPFVPAYVAGSDRPHVTDYDSLIRGRVKPGSNVVVMGGQNLGMITAEFLADKGAHVTVIEQTGALSTDLEYMAREMLLARVNRSNQITVRLNSNVEQINDDTVIVQSGGAYETISGIDQVVFANVRERNTDLFEEVSLGLSERLNIQVHLIGDAEWTREPYDAMMEGTMLARAI